MSTPKFPKPGVPLFEPRTLTNDERAAILPWRRKYLAQTDKAERYRIIKEDIFAAMFNYWDDIKEGALARQQEPGRVKMIMGFIHNNWRRTTTLQFNSSGEVIVRRHDLIYETMRKRVDAEITSILKLDQPVTTSHPDYFPNLNVGISQVGKSLTPEEDAVLRDIQQERQKLGNPPEVQKRIFAKSGRQRINKAAAVHWKEMGVLQWNLIAYKKEDKKWAVSVLDEMAKNMGVTSAPMITMWKNDVETIQRIMLRYVNILSTLANPNDTTAGPSGSEEYKPRHDLQIHLSPEGYPMMPDAPKDQNVQNIKDLIHLMRNFLNQHYRIASGGRSMPAPYTKVAADNSSFVDPQYLPNEVKLRDPTNMPKSEILAFIQHIRTRQLSHGHADAFRWKHFEHAGELLSARYNIPQDSAAETDVTVQRKKARANAAKARRQKSKGTRKGKEKEKEKGKAKEMETPTVKAETEPGSGLSSTNCLAWAEGLTGNCTYALQGIPSQDLPSSLIPDSTITSQPQLVLPYSNVPTDYHFQDDIWPNSGAMDFFAPTYTPAVTDQNSQITLPMYGVSPHYTFSKESLGESSNDGGHNISGRNFLGSPFQIKANAAAVFPMASSSTSVLHSAWMPLYPDFVPPGNGPPAHQHTHDVQQQPDMSRTRSLTYVEQSSGGVQTTGVVNVVQAEVTSVKRRRATPVMDVQQLPSTTNDNRPRKRTKTNDDLAAEEAARYTGGAGIRPRARTTYKDMILLKGSKM